METWTLRRAAAAAGLLVCWFASCWGFRSREETCASRDAGKSVSSWLEETGTGTGTGAIALCHVVRSPYLSLSLSFSLPDLHRSQPL